MTVVQDDANPGDLERVGRGRLSRVGCRRIAIEADASAGRGIPRSAVVARRRRLGVIAISSLRVRRIRRWIIRSLSVRFTPATKVKPVGSNAPGKTCARPRPRHPTQPLWDIATWQ